ncbi:hypothetical protein HGRIS_002605 [Hohenbuehelia grisea]|uniref:Homeobox domain-containing protein n=1 Tax=Hohenbuehelia grisea TaxID=104357 RepID=A0ABR3JL22_9AGAR
MNHSLAYPQPTYPLPTMDPSSSDFRAFFAYTPNEVKHRKRTTGAQLKVLEGVFKKDTKPNAALRKQLASQLDMTPRGVQVWFQNRRAKEKNKASKVVLSASTSKDSSDVDGPGLEPSASPLSSEDLDLPPESPLDMVQAFGEGAERSPHDDTPDVKQHFVGDAAHAPWQGSTVPRPAHLALSGDSNNVLISNLRRGSLPVNALPPSPSSTYGPPVIDQFDPLARRRSVDASLHRLASNPYAPLARAKNGALYASRVVAHGHHHPAVFYAPLSRPSLPHRATMPPGIDVRRASLDSRFLSSDQSGLSISPSPSPLSPYRQLHPTYAISSRSIPPQPLPGPLPSPDFSFGAPTSPSITSAGLTDDRGSPDSAHNFAYRDDLDQDDDSSTSYGGFSRFGSIASVATSESSALYSDNCHAEHDLAGYDPTARRDSCASTFLDVMSNLSVAAQTPNSQESNSPQNGYDTAQNLDANLHNPEAVSSAAPYPSPTSTVSPGGSPHQHESPPVPISRSSELAFALQDNHPSQSRKNSVDSSQVLPPPTAEYSNHVPNHQIPAVIQSPPDAGYQSFDSSAYPQPEPSLELPVDFSEKYHQFDPNYSMLSATNAYATSFGAPQAVSPYDGQVSASLENQHQMDLRMVPNQADPHQTMNGTCASPADMYPQHHAHHHAHAMYTGDQGMSTIENGLHGVPYTGYA